MELSLFRRRKIPLLFLLGVGIPSLALGYLAFRGIRNELALLEQRRAGEHRAIARLAADTIAGRIAEAERAFAAAVAGPADPFSTDSTDTADTLKAVTPLVTEVFFLEDLQTITLPSSDLLFAPDGSLPPPPASDWAAAAASWRGGQDREFREHRYRSAAESYERAFDEASGPALKGEALVAVAHARRKAGDRQAAIEAYETLAAEFTHIRTGAGVALGPTARLELASLLLETGDSAGARDALLDLYRRLVDREWTLERAQFDFFTAEAGDALDALAAVASPDSNGNALTNLREREDRRRNTSERLLLFQQTAANELAARITPGDVVSGETGSRFALESGGRTWLVSMLLQTRTEGGIWGLLLDEEYLGSTLRRVLDEHVDTATTDWVVRDAGGSTVLARGQSPVGTLTVNATLAGNFPPWFIEFHQQPESAYRRLFASGQSVYLYMFMLIASILAFGLVLTVRAVSHELELARLKSDFVSTVSHEFKSPLTSIRQMAEMLQGGRVPGEERRQRYYDVLVEQSTRLSSLVTNILDLARIDEGRKEFRFEPVDIGDLLSDLATMTQHRVGHDGFTVRTRIEDSLPPVRADRDALSQAISNLVDNAIQYSGDAKEIGIDASAGDEHVTVTVEDSGIGIPEEEIDRVFERFFRGGDALTRTVKGSGLGLTLVREIVEAHGGTVQVQSAPDQGSRFSIRLPAMTEQSDAEDPDHRG